MSRTGFYTKESVDAWNRLLNIDSCAIPQLEQYSKEQWPTPPWVVAEIQRTFHLGFMIAKGEIKLPEYPAKPICAATQNSKT